MKKAMMTFAIALLLTTFAHAKLQPNLPSHLPQRGELSEFQKTLDGDILVTEDNFIDAEADRYFAEQQKLAPVNEWEHKLKLLTFKTQSVVRQNRDTLYSKALVDVSKGATFSVKKSNQYQTLHVIDSNHREIFVLYSDSDERTKTIGMSDLSEGAGIHVYVILRTAMPNGESSEAYKVANKLQRSAIIKANSSHPYVPKGFDQESREATRLALEPKLLTFNLPNAFGAVGAKNVTKYDATVGVGIGWGGLSTEHAHYKILIPEDRSGACQSMTFAAPKFKKGGFFSITTYGPDAYIHADKYAINMNEMEQNEDGTYTVNFNCVGEKNNLEVMKGWTGALRMYRPVDKASIVEFAKKVENPHSASAMTAPTIVTQDNFPQAYTNLRLGGILQKAGSVNKFFTMPVPSSVPEEQFVVRMNRDTPYSVSVIDMSGEDVYVTVPKTDRYVTIQVVDENHETQPMIYGPGRHKITAKTDHAFVIVRALEGDIRRNLVIEAGSAKPFKVKKWDMDSFHAIDKKGNLDFSDGYDQSKAFGNKESGQTDYMNYVGAAGGWGGAMVEDNIYQTSQYFSADACYEATFVDPKAKYFWSATVYNGDGRMFNDKANISSEMNPVKNADGTYTLRFGCEGQPNNLPIAEGNKTGKFNVLIRHYGPSEQVSKGEAGYDATKLIKKIK